MKVLIEATELEYRNGQESNLTEGISEFCNIMN